MTARRLTVRLVLLQLAAHWVAFALTSAFAPRVLLLEPAAAAAMRNIIALLGTVAACLSTGATWLVLAGVRSRAREGERASGRGGDPRSPPLSSLDLIALYEAPSKLCLLSVAFVLVSSIATLFPPLRPQAIDPYTELALVLLLLTMVSTAALPAYVTMRSAVAQAVELAGAVASQGALRLLGELAVGRVRMRFAAAVAAPVAFVALGAILLVDAHVRASDRDARASDAVDMARAVFESPREGAEPDAHSRASIIEAAAGAGYRIYVDPDYDGDRTIQHGEEGETQVAVPLRPGGVLVRFGTTRIAPVVGIYLVLAFVAVALAAILGTRIGAAFAADLALATREIRRAGVAEVMRGTIIHHEARFVNVDALLRAIDALGAVFREFASAQRRAIDAREATERMRGLLLASMSHDLKAPLNAVLGFTELVGRNELTDSQRESLSIIEQRGRELLVLIDTILDSARVEAGELEVAPEATHVGDVVMSSVLEARDLAVGTEVQVMGEVQPGMPTLVVDGTRIVQALTAVVLTAVRFSDRGIVPVRATLPGEGDRLRIEVETSGEGLPLVEREKIFDAFKSAESARRQGGLGLGLQLARSIVEIHGGVIEVDATEGGGMVFRLWLPIENDRASIRERATRSTVVG